jgi:phospholipid-translocating ATPase
MVLWVVIYSFLPANNFFSSTASFVDEVEVLFSNVTFWVTVVFSALVALGEWSECQRRVDLIPP